MSGTKKRLQVGLLSGHAESTALIAKLVSSGLLNNWYVNATMKVTADMAERSVPGSAIRCLDNYNVFDNASPRIDCTEALAGEKVISRFVFDGATVGRQMIAQQLATLLTQGYLGNLLFYTNLHQEMIGWYPESVTFSLADHVRHDALPTPKEIPTAVFTYNTAYGGEPERFSEIIGALAGNGIAMGEWQDM